MNYKEIYYKQTLWKVPENWEVYHIDGDCKNNEYSNLVALPKDVLDKITACNDDEEKENILAPFKRKKWTHPVGISLY
jgi:hypothetical protein